MSEIKALDKLRKYTLCDRGEILTAYFSADEIADEIEAEIADNYMRLPVDADGVPIHVGDVMTLRHGKTCEVVAVSETQFTGKKLGSENCVCHANLHRHVKPRTLEDVLIDAMQFGFSSRAGDDVSEKAREFADEIRELLGGDAE